MQTRERPGTGVFLFGFVSAPQGPEGQGGCFDSPSLGPLDSLPTRNDQGVSPWTQKAEGRGRDMPEKMPSLAYARAFFPGGISPPLRLRMRALRARLFTPLSVTAQSAVPPPPRGEASVPASITARLVVRQSCKKVRLTTKFPSTHGRALGSPSGRAGAKRLRGEQKARLPSPSCRFAPCHLSRTRERQNVTCRLLPPTFTGEVARRAGEGQNSEKSRTV